MLAAIKWNWMSGCASSGRDLQNPTVCATAKLKRPLRVSAYFRTSFTRRGPCESSLTVTHSGFSRHWQPIM